MDYEILNLCGSCGDGGECTDAPAEETKEETTEEVAEGTEGGEEGGEEEKTEEAA